jgi:hypothetical protein
MPGSIGFSGNNNESHAVTLLRTRHTGPMFTRQVSKSAERIEVCSPENPATAANCLRWFIVQTIYR